MDSKECVSNSEWLRLPPYSRCGWLTPTLVCTRDFEEVESGRHTSPPKIRAI
jgi:hypothetical protein